jgi:dihydrolipoamide dehydrogenase
MTRRCEVAIIGAGTAGLSAVQRVRRSTDDFLLINAEPDGTTCARTGCMPSKALIEIANAFARAGKLDDFGVHGVGNLLVDTEHVLQRVRSLRDHYVRSVLQSMEPYRDNTLHGTARFMAPGVVEVNGERIEAKAIVIAAGSRPVVMPEWTDLGDRILTSDDLFEQHSLPRRMAVLGLGSLGLELAQALARLGVEVFGFEASGSVGGLTDPAVNARAIEYFSDEFRIFTDHEAGLQADEEGVRVEAGEQDLVVDKVLVALGRKPNLDTLNLDSLGVELDDNGLPSFNPSTMQVQDLPVYIAGDINTYTPLLHEAADEGFIAGCNALRDQPGEFTRRTPLLVCFSEPNIVQVGEPYERVHDADTIVIGEADFDGQGRAVMSGRDHGMMRFYADDRTSRLLGAELCVPEGEHIGHLLAWAVQQQMTVPAMLAMPFYHPTLEEEVRSALRNIHDRLEAGQSPSRGNACEELPFRGLD